MIKSINNIIPERWEENNFAGGKKSAADKPLSGKTLIRMKSVAAIGDFARVGGISVDKTVTNILKNSAKELMYYVQSEGEVPVKNWYGLAIQAALLRAQEIAFIAGSLNITDAEAITELEASEQQVIEAGNPEGKQILTPEVDAAILVVCDMIKNAHVKAGQSGNLADFVKQYKQKLGNNGFGQTAPQFLYSPTGGPIGSKSEGMTAEGNVSFPDYYTGLATDKNNFDKPYGAGQRPDNATGFDTSVLFNANATPGINSSNINTSSTSTGGTDWGSILNGISNVVNSVANGVQTVGGAINTTAGQLQGTLSGIGANSVSQGIQDNLPLIIGGVVLFIGLIILVIYAAKSK